MKTHILVQRNRKLYLQKSLISESGIVSEDWKVNNEDINETDQQKRV